MVSVVTIVLLEGGWVSEWDFDVEAASTFVDWAIFMRPSGTTC